jgi:DNA helicase-2/ATP-dependent DNA helicase PcrA
VNLPDLIADVAVSGPAEEKNEDAVHLGTIHGSKGLEWDHVILVAFEGGILPNQRAISLENGDRSLADPDDLYRTDASGSIEEERRLAHVALTRARHTATITMARTRHLRGVNKMTRLSQFALEGEISFKKIGPSPVARNTPKAAKPLLKSQRRTMW